MSAERGASRGGTMTMSRPSISIGRSSGEGGGIRSIASRPGVISSKIGSPGRMGHASENFRQTNSLKSLGEFKPSHSVATDRQVKGFNINNTHPWKTEAPRKAIERTKTPIISRGNNDAFPGLKQFQYGMRSEQRKPSTDTSRNQSVTPSEKRVTPTVSRKGFDRKFQPFEFNNAQKQSTRIVERPYRTRQLTTRPFSAHRDGLLNTPSLTNEQFDIKIRKPTIKKDQVRNVSRPHYTTITKEPKMVQFPSPRIEIIPKQVEKQTIPREIFNPKTVSKPAQNQEKIVRNTQQHPEQLQAQKVVDAYVGLGLTPPEAQQKVSKVLEEKRQKEDQKNNTERLILPLPSLIRALPYREEDLEKHIRELVQHKGIEHAQKILKIQGKDIPIEKIFRIAMKEFAVPKKSESPVIVNQPETIPNPQLAPQTQENALLQTKKVQKTSLLQEVTGIFGQMIKKEKIAKQERAEEIKRKEAEQPRYIVDKKAKEKRDSMGTNIVIKMFLMKSMIDSQWDFTFSGKEIAENLPSDVPSPAQSRLAKLRNKKNDGSYAKWREEIARTGEGLSMTEAWGAIRRLNQDLPPVDLAAGPATEVTKKDVELVLNGDEKE